MNKIVRVFMVCLLYIFICLVIAEITLRATQYHYCPLKLKEPKELVKGLGKTDWRLHHVYNDQYCIYDHQLIWRPRKGYGVFNAQGYRGAELNSIKHSNSYRIFVIGDSNSAGPVDINRLGWPDYLQILLQRNNSHVTVTNASCWGYTSYQGLRRFEEILKYQPNIVFISFGANDAHRVKISDKDYLRIKHLIPSNILEFRIIQLSIALRDALLVKWKSNLEPRVNLQDYRKNLEEMISLAKSNNIKIVLLTRPFIGNSQHPLWWKNFGLQYNVLTKRIAEQRGIILIDVYSYFKDKKEYFVDESHFNDTGYKIAAKLIYNGIKNEIY